MRIAYSHSVSIYNFRLFITLVTYILVTSHCVISENTLINKICVKNNFPEFCEGTLNYYRHYFRIKENINALAGLATYLAHEFATKSVNEIIFKKELSKKSHLLESLDVCRTKFIHADVNMRKANALRGDNKYIELKGLVRNSVDEIKACKYEGQSGEFPLEKNIVHLKMLLLIIESICDFSHALLDSVHQTQNNIKRFVVQPSIL